MHTILEKEIQPYEYAFCENVKRLREEKKMSQMELAHLSDLSVGTIDRMERFILPEGMYLSDVIALAYALGVTPSELLLTTS